jgi:protein lysine acetyltransferase
VRTGVKLRALAAVIAGVMMMAGAGGCSPAVGAGPSGHSPGVTKAQVPVRPRPAGPTNLAGCVLTKRGAIIGYAVSEIASSLLMAVRPVSMGRTALDGTPGSGHRAGMAEDLSLSCLCGDVLSDRDAIVADLGRCDVLAAAARADLESLAGLLTPFAAPAGTVLLRRGDVAEQFLLLTSGRAQVAFGEQGAQKVTVVKKGSILGEMALLRGTPRSATVTTVTETRGLKGGRAAFARLVVIPRVLEKVVITARRRLAAGLVPVPVTLRDGTAAGLRPICPGEQYELVRGERLFSAQTRYLRFFAAVDMTPALARYLAEVDYVDHFAWVAVDSGAVPVGGATYVRSASDRALADISFLIEDEFQGRGLGTLLMGAVAVAARRNGIARFAADVLAGNALMCAILHRAGITWQPAHAGVVHGDAAVPDPGTFGITPGTAAALAAVVDELNIRL